MFLLITLDCRLGVAAKVTIDDKQRLAVIESKLGTITWLLTAVGGGVIATLVKLFFGG